MKSKLTKNCIKCFKPAKFWAGHVRKGKEFVFAGWCSERCSKTEGFRGHYIDKMGIEEE